MIQIEAEMEIALCQVMISCVTVRPEGSQTGKASGLGSQGYVEPHGEAQNGIRSKKKQLFQFL